MNCFGDYKKSSIFAPAIEKRWRSPVQSRVPLLRKALKLRPLGGFHSWRSFLLKRDGNTTGTQNDINVHKKGTHYI